MARFKISAWVACLLVGTLASFAYFNLPLPAADYLYVGIAFASFVAVMVGARRTQRRLPWYVFGAGIFSFSVAEAIWVVLDQMGLEPWPSVADVFYLAAYPFIALAVLLLVRDRAPGRDTAGLIDASILTVVMTFLSWVFLMEPYIGDSSLSMVEVLVSIAYPIVDILILGVMVRLIGGSGSRSISFYLLIGGLAAALIADVAYGYVTLTTGYISGSWMDAFWLAQYVLWAVAALHPSAAHISDKADEASGKLNRGRLVLLATASLIAPIVILQEWASGKGNLHIPETVAATAIVFLLVVIRMAGLNRQIDRQMEKLNAQGNVLRAALDERNALAERLHHQAFHDSLTSLSNRALYMEKLQQAVEATATGETPTAAFFIDLDEFKNVNDRLGHAAGDELLVSIAQRLSGALRTGDLAARLGGDEFGLLVYNVENEDVARVVAQRLFYSLSAPFSIVGTTVPVKASVGVALTGEPGETSQDVLRNADAAMYLAKHRGKDRFEIFDMSRHGGILDQIKLRNDFAAAIERNEFVLHYQPIVNLKTRKPVGAEALVRWDHPTRGLLFPNDFIALAEESGAIVQVGAWVLREACRQAATWIQDLPPTESFSMSVNLSARQLTDAGLVDSLAETLQETDLDPRHLVMEMTESVLIQDEEASLARLRKLSGFGVKIAIDDFGTGYSSLTYLQRLPAEILKIDRSFVAGMMDGPEEEALAHAIVKLGDTLDLATVAEGIEDPQQASRLEQLGCPFGQGYFFARPMEADDFGVYLRSQFADNDLPAAQAAPRAVAS